MSILFSHFFQKINQIAPLESDFTEVLAPIAVKPKMLYFYGKMPENVVKSGFSGLKSSKSTENAENFAKSAENALAGVRPKTVAIVGSRHNTRYGEEVAYHLAYELAKRGVIIVSGLAFGIDSIGHRGCLDAGGTTVAVLGTPIDQIYPREHLPLAAEILEKGGAIISEYAPRSAEYADAPFAPGEFVNDAGKRRVDQKLSFLHRNRLIAGLADAVIVVEAAERSGSLNTATHALNQGKDVLAVPGNITSPLSQGCNKLIVAGALPCTGPDDVLKLLFPEDFVKKPGKKPVVKTLYGDNPLETAILTALQSGVRSGEEIMDRNGFTPEVFNQTITLLEIKGRVRPLGANNWALC